MYTGLYLYRGFKSLTFRIKKLVSVDLTGFLFLHVRQNLAKGL